MARAMVQATLPHSDPKALSFTRKNGNYQLTIMGHQNFGVPYGPIPRLMLSFIVGEAIKTKNREIVLGGDSMSAFLRMLGFDARPTGGKTGKITAFRNQTKRLFSSVISCTYSDEERDSGEMMTIADRFSLWWTPKTPEQLNFWESTVTLSQLFFDEIIAAPVPVRMETLKALKGSSLALDVYCFITHRNFYAKKISYIRWEALQWQFGTNYPNTPQGIRDFRKNFAIALKKVSEVYPEASKIRVETDYLVYVPGMPDIPPTIQPSTL